MKRWKKIASSFMAMLAVLVFCTASAFAGELGIDFEKGVIVAEGFGVAPATATVPGQKRLLARRAAIVDAQRNLVEQIHGVQVTAETTVQDLVIANDTIRTRVEGMIKGFEPIEEQENSDGTYRVVLSMPMFGAENSLACAVFEPVEREAFPQPTTINVTVNVNTGSNANANANAQAQADVTQVVVPVPLPPPTAMPPPTPVYQPRSAALQQLASPASTGYRWYPSILAPQQQAAKEPVTAAQQEPEEAAIAPSGDYTGLIVDCTGLGLKPVMSPVIKNADGQSIYGYQNLDYAKVVARGMAGYTRDIHQASRAGDRPAIVKAVSLENYNGSPVLRVVDADAVLTENQATKFLDECAVVFVR